MPALLLHLHLDGLLKLKDVLLSLFQFEPQSFHITQLSFHCPSPDYYWLVRLERRRRGEKERRKGRREERGRRRRRRKRGERRKERVEGRRMGGSGDTGDRRVGKRE